MGNSNDDPVYVAISQLGAQVRACEASVSDVHRRLADTWQKATAAENAAREALRKATAAENASRECARVREERTGYGETKAAAKNAETLAHRAAAHADSAQMSIMTLTDELKRNATKFDNLLASYNKQHDDFKEMKVALEGVTSLALRVSKLELRAASLEHDCGDSSPDDEEETPVDTAAELLRRAIKRIPKRNEQLIDAIETWLEENEGAQ